MVDEIEWNEVTGWPSDVLDDIIDGINEKHYPGFWRDLGMLLTGDFTLEWKVGKTSNPEARARQYGSEYDYMEVVYESTSNHHADLVEQGITDGYIEEDDNDNERRGGGGRLPEGNRTHYVYIVYNTNG
tara:strand:- start:207 stop:593 length:387 start_codon:yes stop_codon:yes gene_type:complete